MISHKATLLLAKAEQEEMLNILQDLRRVIETDKCTFVWSKRKASKKNPERASKIAERVKALAV